MAESEAMMVRLNRDRVAIDRGVFELLFADSVVAHYAGVDEALRDGIITFSTLVELARKAEIPYSLFFAPRPVVESQLERSMSELLRGISKDTFSLNSRSKVTLNDVQNIVKDLIRKQEELKSRDTSLAKNGIVGMLRGKKMPIVEQAALLRVAVGFNLDEFHGFRTKERALEYLISCLESQQILVAQAQRTAMPQQIAKDVKFNGLCVKDVKVPYAFIASGDEGPKAQPAGRRILTLALLLSLIARGRFAVVAFNHHSGTPLHAPEWELAEEFLMPQAAVLPEWGMSLETVADAADRFKVTPSAFAMRLQRLGHIDYETSVLYLKGLDELYQSIPPSQARTPHIHNAVRKYAGAELVRRMFLLLDSGGISSSDFRRIVTLNKLKPAQFTDLRGSL